MKNKKKKEEHLNKKYYMKRGKLEVRGNKGEKKKEKENKELVRWNHKSFYSKVLRDADLASSETGDPQVIILVNGHAVRCLVSQPCRLEVQQHSLVACSDGMC